MRGAVAGGITSPVFAAIQCRIPAHRQAPILPVSYTHLDVYKRQIKTHEMPEFGMLLRIPEQYDKVTYYGYGPEENYWDRRQGSRLGTVSYTHLDV